VTEPQKNYVCVLQLQPVAISSLHPSLTLVSSAAVLRSDVGWRQPKVTTHPNSKLQDLPRSAFDERSMGLEGRETVPIAHLSSAERTLIAACHAYLRSHDAHRRVFLAAVTSTFRVLYVFIVIEHPLREAHRCVNYCAVDCFFRGSSAGLT
jgi:hypothetical protein